MVEWVAEELLWATPKPSPWDPNVSRCELLHEWELPGDVTLYNPSMVVCAGLGIATGVTGFVLVSRQAKVREANVQAAYALTYLTFACMNTMGLINFCFFSNDGDMAKTSAFHKWIFLLDGLFSSATSLNFFLCALSDYGLLKLRTRAVDRWVTLALYAVIFAGYYASIFKGVYAAWKYLYMDLTYYSSSAYFAMTLARMAVRCQLAGLCPLIASIVIGITGLNMLGRRNVQVFFCHWLNGYFTGMDIWYLQSDSSLICLLCFYFMHQRSLARLTGKSKEGREEPSMREPLLV